MHMLHLIIRAMHTHIKTPTNKARTSERRNKTSVTIDMSKHSFLGLLLLKGGVGVLLSVDATT